MELLVGCTWGDRFFDPRNVARYSPEYTPGFTPSRAVRLLNPSCGMQSDSKWGAKKKPNSSSKSEDPRARERQVSLGFAIILLAE